MCKFMFNEDALEMSTMITIYDYSNGEPAVTETVESNKGGLERFKTILLEKLKILYIKMNVYKYIEIFNEYGKFTFDEEMKKYKSDNLNLELEHSYKNLIIKKINQNPMDEVEKETIIELNNKTNVCIL